MNTCDGCEHWQNPWDDDEPDARDVEPSERSQWGTCRLITLHERWGAEKVALPAFTKDGSDYRADLHTRADFGCTLWAPKVATPPTE